MDESLIADVKSIVDSVGGIYRPRTPLQIYVPKSWTIIYIYDIVYHTLRSLKLKRKRSNKVQEIEEKRYFITLLYIIFDADRENEYSVASRMKIKTQYGKKYY